MIRPTVHEDTPALVELARGTGMFKPAELVALREVLDDYHAEEQANGHRAVTSVRDGKPVGFAYYAPAALSVRGWYLWWIAVDQALQGQGIGAELLRFAETEIAAAGGRLMFIETSGQPLYEPTRRFYLALGYEVAAVVRDFYDDGDDQVIFARRFAPARRTDAG